MRGPKRHPDQRERDLVVIADLYCQGKFQAEIAAQLGVSRQQISYDIRDLHKRWRKAMVEKIDDHKMRELARIDHLERTAWEAWEKSCLNAEATTVKKIKGRQATNNEGTLVSLSDLTTKQRTTRGQSGDPRFLERVSWCINKRCEIIGLDAPKKIAPTTPDGEDEWNPDSNDRSAVIREALARLGFESGVSARNGQAPEHGSSVDRSGPDHPPSGNGA